MYKVNPIINVETINDGKILNILFKIKSIREYLFSICGIKKPVTRKKSVTPSIPV